MESKPILSGINLVKSYDRFKALDDVSISVVKGAITVILGPSGSGKTTLLNILALLDKPDSGKIIIDGEDTTSFSEQKMADVRNRKFGFVFQFFYLMPELTVVENIMIPLMIRNNTGPVKNLRERAISLLEEFHLGSKTSCYPGQLSGGEKQKVAICRSLIGDPEIIFADEPTGNLDRDSASEFISLISSLNKKGRTFVIVTHNENFLKIATNVLY